MKSVYKEDIHMQNTNFKNGQIVYIIANGSFIKEARIVHVAQSSRMYTLKFTEESGGTKLRESRLYTTKEEAIQAMKNKTYSSNRNVSANKKSYK